MILGDYVKLLIFPYPLVCDYSYNSIPFTTFGNPWSLASLIIYLALGVFGIWGLVKKPKDPLVFTVLFYLAAISLFSNILILIGSPMAERFAFFASVGICLAIPLMVEKWVLKTDADATYVTNSKILSIIIPIALVYAGMTFSRNADWLDNLSLFKADVNKSPNDSRLAYYYGTELVTRADHEGNPTVKQQWLSDGVVALRRSLSIYPTYENALAQSLATHISIPGKMTPQRSTIKRPSP